MALQKSQILPEVSARRRWCVTAPSGATPEDLCIPEYWKHIARECGLRDNDIVTATCLDGSWYCEYIVLHVGPVHAKLQPIMEPVVLIDLSEAVDKSDTFKAVWKGPAARWCVQRISDGELTKTKFQTKEQAVVWINTQAKALAA